MDKKRDLGWVSFGSLMALCDAMLCAFLLSNRGTIMKACHSQRIIQVALILNLIQLTIFLHVIYMLMKGQPKRIEDRVLQYFDHEVSIHNQAPSKRPGDRSYTNEELAQEILKTQAKLSSLQAQINPHFLYNTLETIRGKAMARDEEEIASMIETLARLFRYNIGVTDEFSTLAEELDSVKLFVKIQNYRFDDKFILKINTEDLSDAEEHHVLPFLCIQPLVENAIRHGLEKKIGKGTIEIKCFTTQSKLIIDVIDDGIGIDEARVIELNRRLQEFTQIPERDQIRSRGAGIALLNVQQRIKLFFGQEYGISIISAPEIGTKIEMSLPKNAEKREAT